MAFFLITWDGGKYANDELYAAVIVGGEKAFTRGLANRTIVGKKLFDQTLYSLTEEQEKRCLEYSPITQDFEGFFKHLNVVSGSVLNQLKRGRCSRALPDATLLTVSPNIISEQYTYRQVTFFRARDFKENKKYKMVSKMAAVKVCGFLYVAINAVDVRIENPIVVTLKN